jgi:hypothetical protein
MVPQYPAAKQKRLRRKRKYPSLYAAFNSPIPYLFNYPLSAIITPKLPLSDRRSRGKSSGLRMAAIPGLPTVLPRIILPTVEGLGEVKHRGEVIFWDQLLVDHQLRK